MSYFKPATTNYESPEVDMKSTGVTLLYTTPADKGDFIITEIVAIPNNVTGTGTQPIINLGTNSATYDDILNGQTLAMVNNNKSESLLGTGEFLIIPASTDIYVNVTTAATGYTTFDAEIYIRGFFHTS